MTPELGHLALILALLISIVQGVLPLIGAHRGHAGWIALARPAAQTQFVLVAFAFGCLMQAFLANDFSVAYVANHSNSKLPTAFRAAAVWGGHEGSLLLWLLMLTGWSCAVSLFSRQLPQAMVARVLGVLGLVGMGFLLFMLLTSNPFDRLLPAATDHGIDDKSMMLNRGNTVYESENHPSCHPGCCIPRGVRSRRRPRTGSAAGRL